MIRLATSADAAAMAELHVAAWRETYAGLMPDNMLASLSVARRTERWSDITQHPENFGKSIAFVAEEGGCVVGLAACCEQRTAALHDQGFTGEISAIYVLRRAQRRGIGSALMARMAEALLQRDCRRASLWVLRENATARCFYEKRGGEAIAQKEDARDGATLIEVAYGWRDVATLCAGQPF